MNFGVLATSQSLHLSVFKTLCSVMEFDYLHIIQCILHNSFALCIQPRSWLIFRYKSMWVSKIYILTSMQFHRQINKYYFSVCYSSTTMLGLNAHSLFALYICDGHLAIRLHVRTSYFFTTYTHINMSHTARASNEEVRMPSNRVFTNFVIVALSHDVQGKSDVCLIPLIIHKRFS